MSTTVTPPDGPETQDGETPRNVRILQVIVVVLGIILIVGMATVIGRIAYLMMRPANDAVTTAPYPEPQVPITVGLPSSAKVMSTSLDGSQLAVHHSSPSGDGIAILDLKSGRVIRRVSIVTGDAKEASGKTAPAQ